MYSDLHPLELNNDYSKPIVIPLNNNPSKLKDLLNLFNIDKNSNGASCSKKPNMPSFNKLDLEPYENKFNFTVGNKPATFTSEFKPFNKVNKPFIDSFDKTKKVLFPCESKNISRNSLTENIQYETIIVFLISFIILFLLSTNISFLSYEDKELNRQRPNLFRIMLLSFVIAVFFLMQSNISLLENI